MDHDTQEKLARSLTAETVELLPFLPYLLQDLWELGSIPKDMIDLIRRHMPFSEETKILDLACGKGAASVQIAQALPVQVYGFDLIPEFIEYAREKARELGVVDRCRFQVGDANDVVQSEKNYDCVIFSSAGNILGNPKDTLQKLISTVKPGGFILIDEAYLREDVENDDLKCQYDGYIKFSQWTALFQELGLKLAKELPFAGEYDFDADNRAVAVRARELSERYPEKRSMFEGYVTSQLNECDDIESRLVCVTWMLRT